MLDTRLRALGTTHGAVEAFIQHTRSASQHFQPLLQSLGARGLGDFVRIDPGIVRGLAYYTGTVFEFFRSNAACGRSPAAAATTSCAD